ncbi:MAG: hypothetical protein EPO51_06520 [Phenylobacterium sp.]|uniref:hypothetical protein n=1 Tax=Phenylobacterium sp. TaxID=1871053 RepID=UPI001202BE8E|nr:hypothetical protein [Phenylobacterium sp.]TAJ73286.1 MAG: hypothetical protein EPO51_06520 [Phenylobacterium sp.]
MGRSEIHLPADWSKSAAGPSNRYEGKTFTGRVLLDGASFERCEFKGAVLIYAGGVPPRIANCSFVQTSFEFQDAAGRTLAFLQAMAAPSSGLSAVFKASFARLFGH